MKPKKGIDLIGYAMYLTEGSVVLSCNSSIKQTDSSILIQALLLLGCFILPYRNRKR
jgi:hypothetical protein